MATIKGFTASFAAATQDIFERMANDPISAMYQDIIIAASNGKDYQCESIVGLSKFLECQSSLKDNGFQVVKTGYDEESGLVTFKISW